MSVGDRKLDIFASMFRSAVHDPFEWAPPQLRRVTVVSDAGPEATSQAVAHAKRLLSTIDSAGELSWTVLDQTHWVDGPSAPIPTLLEQLAASPADLIVTWRHLLGSVRDLKWTLGSVVDTLTQASDTPVLLLPNPGGEHIAAMIDTQKVMVVTNHLEGDHRLVNWGVHMTHKTGTLTLAHVEDDATIDRVLNAIGKLPHLNSDVARIALPAKLLQGATDYINSVTSVLHDHQIQETVVPLVKLGHALTDYCALIEEHNVDLLIFNSKDTSQNAMQGMAHALAVEIRDRPLLLL
ncbi:MAG: hypothetical protein GWP91_25990 [Rhodobacterales bacterium]|nr:hypothetical protein [Rhodobacterales bacterium]